MRRLFMLLMFLISVGTTTIVVAQSQDAVTELVDSVNGNGVELFSDTTAVDTADQQVVTSNYTDNDIEVDSDFAPGLLFGSAILFFIVFIVLPLFILLLPLLALILIVVLLLRRDRKRRRQQEDADALNNNTETLINDNMPNKKKLRRSDDRVIAGVCSGLAEYFDFDPTAVRVAFALLTFFTAFSGIPCYIILWLLMPQK